MNCERTFSKLKYILNRLRNCLSQEKLESFLLMSVERDILNNVSNTSIMDIICQKSNTMKNLLSL